MTSACDMIILWNKDTHSADDYLTSPDGMQLLAASCMMIESIGEGLKKIDRIFPDFLVSNAPDTPWKEIKGLRDHIAHGYFNIDADIVYDVVANEIPTLKTILNDLASRVSRLA
jgi:uncharacterized protein with HEPN domain